MYSEDHDADAALDRGRRLRAEIDEADEPVGVLVVADGLAHPHTARARRLRPRLDPVQAALDDALAGGDAAALARLPRAVVGRVACRCSPGWRAGAADGEGALSRGALRRRVFRRRLASMRPLAIIGPTGTGKSALALAVAEGWRRVGVKS